MTPWPLLGRREFTPVPSQGSIFAFMIPPQNKTSCRRELPRREFIPLRFFALKYKGVVYLPKKYVARVRRGLCFIPVKIVFLRLTSPW